MSWPWIAWALLGYGCGSVPFAWLLAKSRGIDIRRQGSGNVGATNVARTLGRKWGVLCFTLDLLKGFGPVLGAGLAMGVVASTRLDSSDSWWWLLVVLSVGSPGSGVGVPEDPVPALLTGRTLDHR